MSFFSLVDSDSWRIISLGLIKRGGKEKQRKVFLGDTYICAVNSGAIGARFKYLTLELVHLLLGLGEISVRSTLGATCTHL